MTKNISVSAPNDLLAEGRPKLRDMELNAFVDLDSGGDRDWRSFTGLCLCLAGGVIAYKTRLQPTVALSSTEAEFMAACDAGKMLLYTRSIL